MIKDTQIGIGIVHCQSAPGSTSIGYNRVFTSDNGTWSNLIDDTGSVFNYVKWEHDVILRMIKFVSEGWYICSMKQVAGRDDEYRASWIYFPASIELSQKDIKTIVDAVDTQIKDRDYDADYLQELAKKYNKIIADSPRYSIPTNQSGYAYRYDNDQINLYDLYSCMYQKEFTKYEWVLLMPKDSLTVKGEIKNISDIKIIESHIISPITNPDGFIPHLNDGTIFSSPIRVMDGESLQIIWKKSGYLDVPKTVNSQADVELNKSEYRRYYWIHNFRPMEIGTKKAINGVTIDFKVGIPRTDQSGKQFLVIKETEVSSVKFIPRVEGYVQEEFDMDFTDKKAADIIEFELTPESHHYEFVFRLNTDVVRQKNIDKKEISFVITSQKKITESDIQSLIPGYTCVGSVSDKIANYLREAPTKAVSNGGRSGGGNSGYNTGYYGNQGKHTGYRDAEPVKKGHGTNHNGRSNNNYVDIPDYGSNDKRPTTISDILKKVGLVVLILALLGILGYFVYDEWFRNDTPVDQGYYNGRDGNGDGDNIETSWDDAKNYLEKTAQIRKEEMETYEDLKGLYDIINEYRFKDYVTYIDGNKHRDDILSIDVWKRLYDKSKEIGTNKKGVFNKEDQDQSITLENFLKKDFTGLEDVNGVDNNQNNVSSGQQASQPSSHDNQNGSSHSSLQNNHNSGQGNSQRTGQQGGNGSNSQQNNSQSNNI